MGKKAATTKTKSGKPFLAARIPEGLDKALQDYVDLNGGSRTDILIDALSVYLGWSNGEQPKPATSDRLSRLEQRLETLETEIYRPKQTSLLTGEAGVQEEYSTVIKQDNKPDDSSQEEEWLTTTEAFERYGEKMAASTFRKLQPKELLARFGLHSDPSKKGRGRIPSKWIKASS